MKRFILFCAVILLAVPRVVYSQCTDSSTVSEINLYLLKGAEARERLKTCHEYRSIDSAIITQQEAALQVQRKQITTYRAVCIALTVLFLLAL